MAGLRAAMTLGTGTHNKYVVDLYEASERIGGRLYTHKFYRGGEFDYFVGTINWMS